jgi:polar amino acid transport system substrate-binding protein
MRMRIMLVLAAFTVAAAGCGATTSPVSVTVPAAEVWPSGAQQVAEAPTAGTGAGTDECDREASLRPGPLPPPGAMPPGSTMAAIVERGRLVVGVDQNTYLFGYRNPTSGQLEGFDIDVAREIARSIFGDPNRIDPLIVDANQRVPALQSGEVDLVVRTFSITCDRKQDVDFSTVYFRADQRILARKGSGIDSAAALAGKRVCAVSGTTSLSVLSALQPGPTLFKAATWTDCLVMLQQGQVDAISTDDSVLFGLKKQDPTLDIGGPSMGVEPYGIGVKKENEDLVRFVNGVLEQMRSDGTWQRLYEKWLADLGSSPDPPAARYQD